MQRDPVDDNENYWQNTFYFNPKDRRIIVPKRMRWFGFTLNFAKPESYLLIALILFIGIYSVI